ncbi:MAG TPA: hypothetical protein VFX16_00370 [Pseudonocardiaceae bacterium]|nr:hypothetical protein [Pseudonocardiaceae bacterium]
MRVLGTDPADTPPIVRYRLISDQRRHETVRLWETRLVAGRRGYALGAVGRDRGTLVLRPARHAGFTVFTHR